MDNRPRTSLRTVLSNTLDASIAPSLFVLPTPARKPEVNQPKRNRGLHLIARSGIKLEPITPRDVRTRPVDSLAHAHLIVAQIEREMEEQAALRQSSAEPVANTTVAFSSKAAVRTNPFSLRFNRETPLVVARRLLSTLIARIA